MVTAVSAFYTHVSHARAVNSRQKRIVRCMSEIYLPLTHAVIRERWLTVKMEWEREDWKFMAVAARCLCLAPRLMTSSAAVALVTDTCSNTTVSA